METVSSSETLPSTYKSTRCQNPEQQHHHRLRVFENRVLRKLGLLWDEVTGGWRKLHNEELHGLYSSPSIIRMRWAGHVVLVR
jgi:hypothetical protein